MTEDDDIRRLHRTDDHETSVEAAELVFDKIKLLQRIVLRFLTIAGPRGLTDYELEELCGNHGSTYRTRRSELVEKGFVVNSGKRREINGRNRIVWTVRNRSTTFRFTTDHLKRISHQQQEHST